jgi:signal transduction histidine kinase
MAVETDIRDFNLGESIDKALSLVQDKLGSSYTITKELARDAVLRGDEAAFIRMWTHLIQNALEAMPSGGRLSINLTGDTSLFRVAIGDTGSGVDPSIRDRLFEAFVTTKPTAEGLGLGLSYCKRVAEEVGGSIDYETNDAGTVFTVILPRERKPA